MPETLVLAVEDGWDSVHILQEPSSTVRAICGFRPTIVWRRIWVAEAPSLDLTPACARCRLLVGTTPRIVSSTVSRATRQDAVALAQAAVGHRR